MLLALVFALAVIGALAYGRTPDYSKMRRPNPYETLYQYAAFELDASALCEKISPSTVLPGGFFIAPDYARSDCYANIARRFDRPSLCWNARRLGAFAPLSQQTSPLACLVGVLRHAPDASLSTDMPDRKDLVSIFAEMGYRPEQLHREGLTPPLPDMADAYRRLAQYPDVVRRIAAVTDRSNARPPITPAERMNLFELAAHVSNDVSWCERIPADLLDPGAAAKGPSSFQRDRCILEIASNARHPDLCMLIPARRDGSIGATSSRSVCERQAMQAPDKFRYGAPAVQSEADARQMIATLGYPLLDVNALPANEIESAYFEFIWQMSVAGKSAADSPAVIAARAKFLARVAALPSYP